MRHQIKISVGLILAISLAIAQSSAFADETKHFSSNEAAKEAACARVGKKYDKTGMLPNMDTCKARCVGKDGKVNFENLADGSACMCFARAKFGEKGVCQEGKCIY